MAPELTDVEPEQRALEPFAGPNSVELHWAVERARHFARSEKAANTRRAYRTDFALFRAWCETRGVDALPALPETVCAFLAAEADRGLKAATISRRVAAIRYAHKLASLLVPTEIETVRAVVRGIRRTIGTAGTPKAPATSDRLLAMVACQKKEAQNAKWVSGSPSRDGADRATLTALRNNALLLIGFAGAFRRSELVALDVADVIECDAGLRVTIRGSKTDQERVGTTVAVVRGSVICPVEALKAWIAGAGITEGPIFRPINKGGKVMPARLTPQSVSLVIKAHAKCAGLDPQLFAGHSLRSGFLTSAARRGASIFKMMDSSRHRSVDSLRSYVRDGELFRDHAGAGLL